MYDGLALLWTCGAMQRSLLKRKEFHCPLPPGSEATRGRIVSAANPHLLRFSQICPRLTTLWSFSLLRRNRRLAAQSQDQTYIFLICRI